MARHREHSIHHPPRAPFAKKRAVRVAITRLQRGVEGFELGIVERQDEEGLVGREGRRSERLIKDAQR